MARLASPKQKRYQELSGTRFMLDGLCGNSSALIHRLREFPDAQQLLREANHSLNMARGILRDRIKEEFPTKPLKENHDQTQT
jgi:hypothetical protein